MSYFPIVIRVTETNQTYLVKDISDLPNNTSFKVLATQVKILCQ